jgi:hypothetical protein
VDLTFVCAPNRQSNVAQKGGPPVELVSSSASTGSAVGRVERRDAQSRERLVRRVVSEYQQMPGLRLTMVQARRLFGLDLAACERVLSGLVAIGFLTQNSRGLYQRRDLAV